MSLPQRLQKRTSASIVVSSPFTGYVSDTVRTMLPTLRLQQGQYMFLSFFNIRKTPWLYVVSAVGLEPTRCFHQRFLRPPSLPIPSCRRLSDFSASDGVTPAAATERKERIQGAGRHPEKYTLSDLRPNHQKSSRIFSHQGDQSELRGATPNFWPQSFDHFFLSVPRAFRPGQPSSPKVIEGFRQTMNTRIAKAPGRD